MAKKHVTRDPRDRKHKNVAKHVNAHNGGDVDESNAQEVLPESKTEREIRRAQLSADLRESQPESKLTSKKKKRLDKYVDTKLRKEENLDLLKKLAAHKVDTSLLQSSKKLGRVSETRKEQITRALDERAAGIKSEEHDAILLQRRRDGDPSVYDEEESDSAEEEDAEVTTSGAPRVATPAAPMGPGSGLKRPLEMDEEGQPLIKRRKRRKGKTVPSVAPPAISDSDEPDSDHASEGTPDELLTESEDEWNGFDSDDALGEEPASGVLHTAGNGVGETDLSSESDLDDEDASTEDGDDVDSGSESASSVASDRKERVSAFKQWADSQRNIAMEFTPSTVPTDDAELRAKFRPRQQSPDASLPPLQSSGERTSRPAAAITIPRSEEIQAARLQLPVVQEEQKIMEAIHSNPIVIVCGATGSGKTTQVPQMMFESGYGSHIGNKDASVSAGAQSRGMIGVTQPRRVAALSVAERVATEVGPAYRKRIAHQVRYDTNVGKESAIKFMTDGILLREISQDFILSKYSAIIIDEAHERSVNTDILIGMLSRIVSLRSELAKEDPEKHYPLKLVIMSATLRVSDFAENPRLFRSGTPPIVQAEGRQYPVTVHFNRRTQRDFVTETVEKVARGHRKLPPGGMLVFLTSQNEIQLVAKQLRDKLGSNTASYGIGKARQQSEHEPLDMDDLEDERSQRRNNDYLEGEEDHDSDSEAEITGLDPDAEDDAEFHVEDDQPQYGSRDNGALKPHILPLYAALPSAQQLRVFQPAPAGSRMIVLSTNVAETSLTIPGVRYVFDCGRAKSKRYDISTGVQTFEIDWISQASASQRSGRAGRTGPGHCYRLYSSAVYERYFAEHTTPEILRTPLESTVLQLKSMEIENVVNFPFPTSPDASQLVQADRLLKSLGAIDERDGRITDIGREIMGFPVSPRFGKMLLFAQRNGVLAHTIALVAGLAVGDLYIPEMQVAGVSAAETDVPADDNSSSDEDELHVRRGRTVAESVAHTAAQQRHKDYTSAQAKLSQWDRESDAMKLLSAVAAYAERTAGNKSMSAASSFCESFYLREKGMSEVQQLRHQLLNIVGARSPGLIGTVKDALPIATEKEVKMLNQIVTAGFIDQVAIRSDLLASDVPAFSRPPRRAIEVAYRTLVPSAEVDQKLSPQEQELLRSVFIHPSSVLSRLTVKEMPRYIVYSHLSRAAPAVIDSAKVPRTRMHPLTTARAEQLARLAEGTPLLEMGKPIGKIEEVAGGKRQCWVPVGLKPPGGVGASWPLGAWKVLQRKGKKEWEVEQVVAR